MKNNCGTLNASLHSMTKTLKSNVLRFAMISLTSLSVVAPTTSFAQRGGADTGGGNAVGPFIVESYIKPIEEISGYNEVVVPVMENAGAKVPGLRVAMESAIANISWYMIPAPIKPLAEKYVGLPFASDQIAVQKISTSEVFTDTNLFMSKKMSTQERGRQLLHEIFENILMRRCFSMGQCEYRRDSFMKGVRVSVNLLSRTTTMSNEELSKALWDLGWDHDVVKSAEVIAQEKAKAQALARQEREDLEANLPVYNQILSQVFGALDNYCANAGAYGITYEQVYKELSRSEENLLRRELSALSGATMGIAFKTGLISLNNAPENGFRTQSLLPLYNDVIAKWAERDFGRLFVQSRTIPWTVPDSRPIVTNSKYFGFGEQITNLHKVCKDLPNMKAEIRKNLSK